MNAVPAIQPVLQPGKSSDSSGRRYTGMVVSFPQPPVLVERNCSQDGAIERGPGDEASNKRKRDDLHRHQGALTTHTTPASDGKGPLLVLPSDVQYVTDFHLLLYAQVHRSPSEKQDLDTGLRKLGNKLHTGFMGLRCRHCGGSDRGNYFPTSSKHLQSCSNNIYNHLNTCKCIPAALKRALNRAKVAHQRQMVSKPKGSQAVFFAKLYDRIHNQAFAGASGNDQQVLLKKLDNIVAQSVPLKTAAPAPSLPNVVSYEDAYEPMKLESSDTTVTEEDFEIALDLLRRPPTPDPHIDFYDASLADLNVSPAPVSFATADSSPAPVSFATADSSSSDHCQDWVHPLPPPKRRKTSTYHQTPGRRKFTRSEEILLIRGMMLHGEKGKWKKIYDQTPGLAHIKHCALKDRARSNRFLKIYERAKRDPALLDRPDELCGKADSPAYTI